MDLQDKEKKKKKYYQVALKSHHAAYLLLDFCGYQNSVSEYDASG